MAGDTEISKLKLAETLKADADVPVSQDGGTFRVKGSTILQAGQVITFKAGMTIVKGRAVKLENGKLFYVDKSNVNDYNKCIGLSGNSANVDEDVVLINNNTLQNIGFLLTANDKYYVGDSVGQITNTPTISGLLIEIGYAINTSDIFVSTKNTYEII